MCGIAGIVGERATSERIENMLLAQAHRGPDFTDHYTKSNLVSFGHNRLSIIDLSADANQPMFSSCGRYVMIFNGEIYNYLEIKPRLKRYEFKTHSDSEVLLAAYKEWGKSCLSELVGMFSFAIWDIQDQKLFAARDRFGVKPFYYSMHEQSLYFSSEIQTLHAGGVKKVPNENVWSEFLGYGSYGSPDQTFWEGIKQLPGGHYLEYKDQKIKVERWYDFVSAVGEQKVHTSFDDLKEEYLVYLKRSLDFRFRADVPVGFNLSGGLDSSTLLAMVDQVHGAENIEAFTFYCNDDRYDELPWVEDLLKHTHHPLNKVLLSAGDVPNIHNTLSRIQGEPYGGIPTIAYSQIFKKARSNGVVVLLDGQGMDEAWAGYDYYTKSSGGLVQGSKDSPVRRNTLSNHFMSIGEKPRFEQPFGEHVKDLQYRDIFYTKIPRALRFNDRVSMMYSTELREPFLDHKLMEFAFAQPTSLKLKNGLTKAVLRELVGEYLPASVSMAPKRPLQTPQREWLANDLKTWVYDSINEMLETKGDWFNADLVMSELNNFMEGKSDNSFYIWQWISVSSVIGNGIKVKL